MSDLADAFALAMEIMIVGGVITGAAIMGLPVGIYSYYKAETITTITQKGMPPLIKTQEHFRSDRVYVPVQTTSNTIEYVPIKNILAHLKF